ncbi:MAG: flagellar motor switch protein FliN [Deltaproteobacteria bacterium]|nr:flagellar motor switch protein FliN [Deltaproteobacteria bacterium]
MPESDKQTKKQEVAPEEIEAATLEKDAQPKAATPKKSKPSGGKNDALSKDMDFLLDIPLEISVELGRTKMLINELLHLGQGSVIELSKLAGETLEIFANQKLVARGEVVVVNEKYGIRLSEIISPSERIKRLK